MDAMLSRNTSRSVPWKTRQQNIRFSVPRNAFECVLLGSEAAKALELADVTPAVTPGGPLPATELALIDVFDRATNSVVNIFDLSLQGRGPSTATVDVPEGNGSGFVWDDQGHIVTNYHVLANIFKGIGPAGLAKKDVKVARVTLLDRDGIQRDYIATVVGVLRSKDLAVIKINAPRDLLQPAALGSSADVKVGQQCLAIGNPFGFDHTLTTGAISGLGRVIQSQAGSTIAGGIQTDAAINPGNSGGPLLDSAGRVIGVNTAIFTATGTSAGVGFAIPIDTVRKIVPQLITYGKVVVPTLGVSFAPAGVARALKVTEGALIQSLDGSSAAAKAGLLGTRRGLSGIVAGDVIVAVNDVRVRKPADVELALDQVSVGERIKVKVKRGVESTPVDMEFEFAVEADKEG